MTEPGLGLSDATPGRYDLLLRDWCDGLLARQYTTGPDISQRGGLLCPSCALIHGRCGDASYPLLAVAHATGEQKYADAAVLLQEWMENQVGMPDGSWINDVTLNPWRGTTVFHTIALGEALKRHGSLLDHSIREKWTRRLESAVRFLDGFLAIGVGTINYAAASSYCFALCADILGIRRYEERARKTAHEVLAYFTPSGLLGGEGHPWHGRSQKGYSAVDLGYNVEESLPALALYALVTQDDHVLERTVTSLRAHMEFMLPDGAWDNSWGTRMFKWTWWGSRTSDGCQAGFALLAKYDPRFAEVARRNFELLAKCTQGGLLYGGPDYFAHGEFPCIHHTFTHAKALATVLDHLGRSPEPTERHALPRDEPYGVRTFPEVGVSLVALGDWRGTVTQYDWPYVEHLASVQEFSGGGHPTGGALSLLFHAVLGPVLTASATEYRMIELSNQQRPRVPVHMTLTPRLEYGHLVKTTSLSDFEATLETNTSDSAVSFEARGRMLTVGHEPHPDGEVRYRLVYRVSETGVVIVARLDAEGSGTLSSSFSLPVVLRPGRTILTTDS